MNPLFSINKSTLSFLYKNLLIFAVIAAIMKTGSLILLNLLPASGVTKSVIESREGFFVSLKTDKIFGLKSTEEKKKATEKEGAKKEEVEVFPLSDLKLKAIFHSRSLSFVTLDDKSGAIFLDIGQSFKGYELFRVYPDKAIFTRDKKQYELRLEEESDKKLAVKAKEIKSVSEKEAVQTMKNVPRDEIKSYQKDMSKIWSNIGLKEHKTSGKLDGFIVTFVKNDSVFQQLGLQKDDILTEANGIKINSYKDALQLYKKIDTIKVFKLTIMRNNEEKELEYEIF